MKQTLFLIDRPVNPNEIHIQGCTCSRCPGGRRALDPVTRTCLLFAAGLILGTLIVAASGRLEAALRALFGL